MNRVFVLCGVMLSALLTPAVGMAQAVCLPAPRLLTTMPMGGQVGTTLDVVITGQNFENAEELSFSTPKITAIPKLNDAGQPIPDQFTVTIAGDCPTGIHEARVMTRLGVSSSRVFSVSALTEASRTKANTTLETAMRLDVDSVCNASMTAQSVDHYSIELQKDQRVVVDCAAKGIDSKLKPVLIIADAEGADLVVERRGGALDFTAPETASYVIKVHDLTYSGGAHHFYRLVVKAADKGEVISRLAATKTVSSFSWPPSGVTDSGAVAETEPNNRHEESQKVTLPIDVTGSFFPAADVDTFEFTAKKGEVWWVEVASERFGLPTDPSIVVQHVAVDGDIETLTDVAELADIASPVKVSSNGYSYDGPPYNAGSTDILGKLEIKADGIHRLQIRDLFGGTRNDPRNVYRLIVRKAAPDFALVGWALHMNLRNGDRNALSKPIALRGGATMPIEVVVVRRDGFNGEIDLFMQDLPEGVSATGLKIPAGKSRGIMLISAEEGAPRGLTSASFFGRATIGDQEVTRPCRLASMAWPVPNAWSEIPSPRLLADVPVSVCGSEFAPITIAAAEDKVWEATAGSKLTIPLKHTRRMDFSGATIGLRAYGAGFEKFPSFDASLKEDSSEAVVDLAALKTPPGDYVIAFYGSAVAKYRYNLEAVRAAEESLKQVKEAAAKKEADPADVTAAEKRLKDATAKAAPKDIVDIVVSTPIRIRVTTAEKVAKK